MKFILLLLVFCLTGLCFSYAQGEQARTVLGIYDSTEELNRRVDYNMIHNNAEVVLNYLGMKVRYHDITRGLPSEKSMEDVSAIFTWFLDDAIPHAQQYCHWLAQEIRHGKRYIMFGNFGAFRDKETKEVTPVSLVNKVFNAMGLEYVGDWTANPFIVEVVKKEGYMIEFERTLDDEITFYERVIPLDRKSRVYLELRRTDIPDSKSAVCVTTPKGGVVLEGYSVFINYRDERTKWRINPFLFFEEALGLKEMPRYDTTTLFGRRIFYSHIDGDGIRNISEIDRESLSGEVIYNEILKKYDLPITVSFVTSEVDPRYFGSDKIASLARRMLSLDNVEPGIHAFSHPLDWEKGITFFVIHEYSKPITVNKKTEFSSESHYSKAAIITVDKGLYLDREIRGAADYVNQNLTPPGKKVLVNQWSGNCQPPAEAIDLATHIGLRNINGGDTRFDRFIPSYTGVAPLVRQIEGRMQVYTSNSNENIYTNEWTGPYDGFLHVIDTFKETEIPTLVKAPPRRIAPINIYYHFYSGEKELSLEALKSVYDYVLGQDIIPVYTSHYIEIVRGFMSGKVRHLGDGVWEFSNYGRCRTVRFDKSKLFPDLVRSKGILGFTRWYDYLYVHLADTNRAVLYLTEKPPRRPYVQEASSVLRDCVISDVRISFTTEGFRNGIYKFANMSPRTEYTARLYSIHEAKPVYVKKFITDKKGTLRLILPVKGAFRIVVDKGV